MFAVTAYRVTGIWGLPCAQRVADGDEQEREAGDDEAAWVFRGIKPEDELTHPHPVRQCMVPVSPYREGDAARVVAHIDDHLL